MAQNAGHSIQTDLTIFMKQGTQKSTVTPSPTREIIASKPDNDIDTKEFVITETNTKPISHTFEIDSELFDSHTTELTPKSQSNRKRKPLDNSTPATRSKHPNNSTTPPDRNSRTFPPLDIEIVSSGTTISTKKEVSFTPPRSTNLASNKETPTNSLTLPPIRQPPHTLLVTYREAGKAPLPSPVAFQDTWDGMHVRMPCSVKNLLHIKSSGSSKQLVNKWGVIESSLQSRISNSFELEEVIRRYNTDAARKWNFSGLHAFFEHYTADEERKDIFQNTLPGMTRLALNLPSLVTAPLPLLRCDQVQDVTLSQIQIACLLANAFFCTFPRRNATGFTSEYANFPGINFHTLFSPDQTPLFESDKNAPSLSKQKANKLKCIFHYFKRVLSDQPAGCVTFRRQQLEQPYEWSLKESTLTNLKIDNEGRIEDAEYNTLKVDFANKMLGGGVLSGGCVQEEIYFLICPEMIISRLFVECLQPHEALVMIGAERFSTYSGYSNTFQWSGNYNDVTPVDTLARRKTYVTAIDALIVRKYTEQFRPYSLRRELDKALAGLLKGDFDTDSCLAVATGNWGCGAFGGDKSLKAVIQLMAAAVAGRDVIYFTFGDNKLGDRLIELHQLLLESRTTVAQLWSCLCTYNQLLKDKAPEEKVASLFKFITDQFSIQSP